MDISMNLWAFTSLAVICSTIMIAIISIPTIIKAKKEAEDSCGDDCNCKQ